jgi:hypothetical protein
MHQFGEGTAQNAAAAMESSQQEELPLRPCRKKTAPGGIDHHNQNGNAKP